MARRSDSPQYDERARLVLIRGKMQGSRAAFDEGDASSRFEVLFNPTEYTIKKEASFAEHSIPGLNAPVFQFKHGQARTLTFELMVDTYTYGGHEDVRESHLKRLESFLMVDRDLHAPPPCKVVWKSLEFVGLLQSLDKRYVLFLEDGTPVRARVSLSLKEYLPIDVQIERMRTQSPDRRKVHLCKDGDTLWGLASDAYGDPRLWRIIARYNELDNVRELSAGSYIIIPPLETINGEPHARR